MRVIEYKYLFFICFLANGFITNAQHRTVGLLSNSREPSDSYTLLAPLFNTQVYLLDDCGNTVHIWASSNRPGASTYLLENGSLLKSEYFPESTFTIGGVGGVIKTIDWDSNVIWEYQISNDSLSHHHDVYPMPNGNILVLVWHKRDEDEVLRNGRAEDRYHSLIVSEEIWELKPIGNDSAEVVWRWSSWDHIVQDTDPSKINHGDVKDKGKININYTEDFASGREWLHMNSIEYDEKNDLILVSVRHFHEMWVIDHSTSIDEAKTSEGGNFNKGGDLLFRFGNPQTFQGAEEQVFFGQHDVRVVESEVGKLKIKLFNNGALRETQYSQIDLLEIKCTDKYFELVDYSVLLNPSQPYFYSSITSGSQYVGENRLLATLGASGRLIEYDLESGKILWEYVSPVTGSGAVSQGEDPVSPDPSKSNTLFKALRYDSNYQGLDLRKLSDDPQPLELNPIPVHCGIVLADIDQAVPVLDYLPGGILNITHQSNRQVQLTIVSLSGRKILSEKFTNFYQGRIAVSNTGLILVNINDGVMNKTYKILTQN